jgi:hypothetical protein
MKIDIIELDNGDDILVEVLDIELPDNIKDKLNKKPIISDLPEDAEAISIVDDIQMSMELLKDDLKSIADSIQDAFKESRPNEFSVEVNFGFVGKGAIPLIVSAKTNASIKVKATWKKE